MSKVRNLFKPYRAVVDPDWGWPLYGYKPTETIGKACCHWETFIGSFVDYWNDAFTSDPLPEYVKQARRYWCRYSMTGYEAFQTIRDRELRP